MFGNYFKIAFRNLWRNKSLSVINLLGLGIGIATCLIIMLFVQHELSYDRYNKKAGRMVRVSFRGTVQGEKMNEASVMPPVAQTLKAEFPEVEEAIRLRHFGTPRLVYGDKSFNNDAFAFVDSNFFRVFTLPLVEGDPATALSEPNSIVITRKVAKKYFGNENPVGKVISFKDGKNAACRVTGIMEEMPSNSHFRFDMFASMTSLPESKEPTWLSSNYYTYLVLQKGYDYKKLEAKLPKIVDKYIGPQLHQAMKVTLSEFRAKGNNISFHLQPVTDIHLYSDIPNDLSAAGDVRYVYIFGAIALFMLLIACINFMNLSTAGASKRAREVGIRKVMGSVRRELVVQFLLESVVVTAIALLLAFVFIYLALPLFNTLSGKDLAFSLSDHPLLLPGLLLFVLVTGILAGSYPAFYLSSFRPVAVLKGTFTSGRASAGFRSGLVVFQFFISIVLIVCTTVVFSQLSYIQHKSLGYDKDQVLVLENTWKLGEKQSTFHRQLLVDSRVAAVSGSGYLPAGPSDNNNFFVYSGDNPSQMIKTLRYDVDESYIPVLGIHVLTGRNFSAELTSDSSAAILNETAARALGWGEGAVGHTFSWNNNRGEKINYHVVGIVRDFHFRSLHEQISPLVMTLSPDYGTMIVKLKSKDVAGVLAGIKKQWDSFGPEDPLSYSFLDDRFNNTYRTERNTGLILGIFAGLTIFVACLGLLGLARFTTEQRRKEIGIRKVLGASVSGIAGLVSMEFLKLVLIAFIIASPVAWLVMNKWLQDFAYRVQINGWVFGVAALLTMLITLFTVSFQSIKAAIANPVKSLRTE